MPVRRNHAKRQATTGVGISGASAVDTNVPLPTESLILSTGAPISLSAPPLVNSGPITITSSIATSSASALPPTPTVNSAAVKSNSIAISTVVGACVGTFVGLALVVCLFIWWSRHTSTKARRTPRSPVAHHRNARGEADQERAGWNKLDEGVMPPISRQMTQEEIDEKNFPMFKKRSPSTRTTKTTRVLEEHGIDMPPLELSKYHPHLAEELALQSPDKPFARRQESGVSWDGETVGDDSFLSLRSVRVESGAMSPTLSMAKMTPPAVASHLQLHRWESAEVLSMDGPAASTSQAQDANPFGDHAVERRKSNGNPFFGANDGDTYRMSRRRSRSNSRDRRSLSRDAHRAHMSMRATVVSQISEVNPFEDLNYTVEPAVEDYRTHGRNDSIASGASGQAFSPSHHAIESLIAAMDLPKGQVQDRLHVTSMQPSMASRDSSVLYGEEVDIGTVLPAPTTPKQEHH